MASKNKPVSGAEQAGTGRAPKAGQFTPGTSGNPKGRPRRDAAQLVLDQVPSPERGFRFDGWFSLLTGIGTAMRDKRESMRFCPDIIDWQEALHIWQGDDLAARIIETLPNEMMREGYDLCITDDDQDDGQGPDAVTPDEDAEVDGPDVKLKATAAALTAKMVAAAKGKPDPKLKKEVEHQWEELGLMDAIHQALNFERAYGGAAILIGAQDGATDMSQPLNTAAVRSIDFLTVLEPRQIQPVGWYGDPQAKKFGRPAIYSLTANSPGMSVTPVSYVSTMRIHESRLVVFDGVRVTNMITSSNFGWGDSILTRVYRVLRDYNLAWSAAGTLVVDFAQAVYKMDGLNELLQEDSKDVFKNRMIGMEMARSIARATMIDSKDDFTRVTTPIQGLDALLDRFTQRLAMAARLPLPLLSGQSPSGLNASGASGDQLRMFYDSARSEQKRKVVPVIRRITQLLMQTLGGEPAQWSIEPHPLWQPTLQEQIQTRKVQADIDAIYLDRGVNRAKQIEQVRFGGKTFSFDNPVVEADKNYGDDAAEYANEATDPKAAKPKLGPDGKPLPTAEGSGVTVPADGAAPVGVPGDGGVAPSGGVSIQQQVMNGAQVTAMVELIEKVAQKEIPPETAQVMLEISFQLKPEDAARMLRPLANFEAPKPPPPVLPFGGGPPKPGAAPDDGATPGAKKVPPKPGAAPDEAA